MAVIEINWHPGNRELRQFAVMWGVFFGAVGGWLVYRSGLGTAAVVVLGQGLLLGTGGYLRPGLMRPLYVAWMAAAFPIGWTISHVLMAVIYFGMIMPIGALMKLTGHAPFEKRADPQARSYWLEREGTRPTESYFKQY